jgi:NADH:ubiquinone oxidoreductase subunit K
MTGLIPTVGFALLATALCGLGVANLLARRAHRKLLAFYDMLLAAKDGQIDAYQKQIAEQDGLIRAQIVMIRHQERRAVAVGLVAPGASSWGAPLQ